LFVVPNALGVTIFVFSIVHLAPGEPLKAVVADDRSADVVSRLKADSGFDRPLPVQYRRGLWRATSGDRGLSVTAGRPVPGEIAGPVGNTFVFAVEAALVSLIRDTCTARGAYR
jgi:peptide/nickel transport system permease protein